MEYVIIDGQVAKKEDANVSVFNKAMFFNFAVYDSMKVVKGQPFFPEFHVERLLDSAELIKLEHSFTKEEVLDSIKLIIKKNNLTDAMIRFLLLGAGDKNEKPHLYLFAVGLTFYNDRDYKKGAKVVTFHGEREAPQSKSKNLLLNFMAFREAADAGARDALLIDSEGYIREGTRTNFFAVKDGKIYTAPLKEVLEGVTLKIVNKLAKDNSIEIVYQKVKLDSIKDYDEFFITSTSMNVIPITLIDDYVCEKGVGPVTKKLIKLFKDYYRREVFHEKDLG